MIKFVQSGDFHLDSVLDSFENSETRRLMLLDSFGKVVDAVVESGADLLFLTGDIFDNDTIQSETIAYLKSKLGEILKTKVFIAPGNHDYIGRNSAWLNIEWPSNVYVFSEFESLYLDDLGIMIHGAGFSDRIQPETILPELAYLDKRWPNILVMHGDIVKNSNYNPLDLSLLDKFDYCALGHRHEFQQGGQNQTIVYAGNPCARGFLETGVKGCVIGSLEQGNIKVEFHPFDFPAFHNLSLDLSGFKTNAQVFELIKKTVLNQADHYKISLMGRNNIELDVAYLSAGIVAGSLAVIDNTKYQRDYDQLKKELTLQGAFTRRMLKLAETEPLALEALEAGFDALEGE